MIQLKLKTEYSFGRTFAPIPRVIQRLKELGCTAAGIVDESTWGHVVWFKACKEAGIQPLLGVTCVVSDNDLTTKMWFLAKNEEGLSELYRATSKSHQQTIKTRRGSMPRLYRNDILNMSKNIIKFAGDITDAKFLKCIKAVIDLSPASLILNHRKKELATKHKLMLISVSDNAFSCIGDKSIYQIAAKSGLKTTPQYILEKLENQDNAKKIARQCIKLKLPHAPSLHAEGDLEALCRAGIKYRKMKWTKVYEKRLKYELDLIRMKNYESYFIIVADMVHYAKKHMLVGPSRGSAAGSLVCYTSRITEIDPLPPGLFFERFIDISRTDLPDIDLDFPDSKRHIVFEYMSKKYGANNVAHIGTVSKFRPRSALIQVCKELSIPPAATSSVKIAIIERAVSDSRATSCLEDTFKETTPGKEFIKNYPEAEIATLLEGHSTHTGVHAAGLLVCDDEIINYATVDAKGIAHIEKGAAETLGLLKIDVLGLRTLSVLEDSGVDIDWYNLKYGDSKVFEVFNKGRLCGIFQFEGQTLRSVASMMKFETIDDVDAATALARPGPLGGGVMLKYVARMRGEEYEPLHPIVAKYMENTYGLPLYQEQTLMIVREIGDFDWVETSLIRKAVSKSLGVEYFKPFWKKFRKGAMAKGMSEVDALGIWNMINAMGAWQMNKAHTFSYAVVSYWTAYLKAHHPLEFAASNMRNARSEDRALMLLREMDMEGIKYIPFDLNKSEINWCAKNGKLYGGFIALKGIGESTAKKLIEARNNNTLTQKQKEYIFKAKNPYKDIFPFHTHYQHLYDDPDANGIACNVSEIIDINKEGDVPHGEERVYLGELIYKNNHDINEMVYVKKRGGKVYPAPFEYLDLRLRDDHGDLGGRIGRFDFERIGRELLEKVPLGSHLMIRAKFFHGIPWAYVQRWKRIDNE